MNGNETHGVIGATAIPAIPVVAGVIMRWRDGRWEYLICQRSGSDDSSSAANFKGMWEFPGGKVKVAETDREALLRELFEELRIVKNEISEIENKPIYTGAVKGDKDGVVYTVRFYLCRANNATPFRKVHSAIKWVALDELWEYEMPPLCEEVKKLLVQPVPVPAPALPQPPQIRIPLQVQNQDTPMIRYAPPEAQVEKWKRGQVKYGPGSLPINPLAHLYEELIDGLNYLDDAKRQGHITAAEHQMCTANLRAMAWWARGAHFEREKK